MTGQPRHTPNVQYDPRTSQIVITHLEISNPEIVTEARHWASGRRGPAVDDARLAAADLSTFARAAIDAGCKAICAAAGTTEIASQHRMISELGQRTEAASRKAAEQIERAAQSTEKVTRVTSEETRRLVTTAAEKMRSDVRLSLDETIKDLRRELETLTGEEAPVAAAARAAVAKAGVDLQDRLDRRLGEAMDGITRKFDHRDPTSPLGHLVTTLRDDHTQAVTELSAQQKDVLTRLEALQISVTATSAAAEAAAKATAASTLKGLPYQDAAHEVLSSLAAATGDEYADTSGHTGRITNNKKGDGLLTVLDQPGAPEGVARVVVEMTNSAARRDWVKYLEECERNRAAHASLGLVRSTDQVPGNGCIRIYGGRRMVMAFDPEEDDPALLRAVVLLLRSQACLAVVRSGGAQVRTAEEKLAQALEMLEKLPDLQKIATTTRANAERLVNGLGTLHSGLGRILNEATQALHEVASNPDAVTSGSIGTDGAPGVSDASAA